MKKKKIAVIVAGRQQEALRMALGLTLADNMVSVFIIDRLLEPGETTELNLHSLAEMGAEIFSTIPVKGLISLSTDEVARKLAEYDAVIPY